MNVDAGDVKWWLKEKKAESAIAMLAVALTIWNYGWLITALLACAAIGLILALIYENRDKIRKGLSEVKKNQENYEKEHGGLHAGTTVADIR